MEVVDSRNSLSNRKLLLNSKQDNSLLTSDLQKSKGITRQNGLESSHIGVENMCSRDNNAYNLDMGYSGENHSAPNGRRGSKGSLVGVNVTFRPVIDDKGVVLVHRHRDRRHTHTAVAPYPTAPLSTEAFSETNNLGSSKTAPSASQSNAGIVFRCRSRSRAKTVTISEAPRNLFKTSQSGSSKGPESRSGMGFVTTLSHGLMGLIRGSSHDKLSQERLAKKEKETNSSKPKDNSNHTSGAVLQSVGAPYCAGAAKLFLNTFTAADDGSSQANRGTKRSEKSSLQTQRRATVSSIGPIPPELKRTEVPHVRSTRPIASLSHYLAYDTYTPHSETGYGSGEQSESIIDTASLSFLERATDECQTLPGLFLPAALLAAFENQIPSSEVYGCDSSKTDKRVVITHNCATSKRPESEEHGETPGTPIPLGFTKLYRNACACGGCWLGIPSEAMRNSCVDIENTLVKQHMTSEVWRDIYMSELINMGSPTVFSGKRSQVGTSEGSSVGAEHQTSHSALGESSGADTDDETNTVECRRTSRNLSVVAEKTSDLFADRAKIVNWMSYVCSKMGFQSSVYFLAVNLFDLYMQRSDKKFTSTQLPPISATAFLQAANIGEVASDGKLPTLREFVSAAPWIESPAQILQLQLDMLTTISTPKSVAATGHNSSDEEDVHSSLLGTLAGKTIFEWTVIFLSAIKAEAEEKPRSVWRHIWPMMKVSGLLADVYHRCLAVGDLSCQRGSNLLVRGSSLVGYVIAQRLTEAFVAIEYGSYLQKGVAQSDTAPTMDKHCQISVIGCPLHRPMTASMKSCSYPRIAGDAGSATMCCEMPALSDFERRQVDIVREVKLFCRTVLHLDLDKRLGDPQDRNVEVESLMQKTSMMRRDTQFLAPLPRHTKPDRSAQLNTPPSQVSTAPSSNVNSPNRSTANSRNASLTRQSAQNKTEFTLEKVAKQLSVGDDQLGESAKEYSDGPVVFDTLGDANKTKSFIERRQRVKTAPAISESRNTHCNDVGGPPTSTTSPSLLVSELYSATIEAEKFPICGDDLGASAPTVVGYLRKLNREQRRHERLIRHHYRVFK